jgi:pilus assembly protein CpaC
MLVPPMTAGDAQAQRLIQISGAKRSAIVSVAVGKTEDVRVESAMTDVAVGDQEVADVTPLTDHSLSILGKKIGTTRVSIYAEGKRLLGFFDVEVSYDVTRLASEINTVVGGGIGVVVSGRIMLSGMVQDAHARQGGGDRAPVRARYHQYGAGRCSPSGSCWGRFIEAKRRRPRSRRGAEHLRARRDRQYRLAQAGDGVLSGLPIGADRPGQYPGRRSRGGRALERSPFGFMSGILGGSTTIDMMINARAARRRAHAGGAQPGRALGRHRNFLAASSIPVPSGWLDRDPISFMAWAWPSPRPCSRTASSTSRSSG